MFLMFYQDTRTSANIRFFLYLFFLFIFLAISDYYNVHKKNLK